MMKLPVVAVGAVLLLGGVLIGASSVRPASAQDQVAPPAAVGRYQMSLKSHPGPHTSTTVFVLDTSTGQCWYRETAGDRPWTDHGSPILGAKQ
jgi:hypothetical protein